MSGRTKPLTVCDRDCAGANGCRIGGYQCARCGLWFCGDEINRHDDELLCDDCMSEIGEYEYENEGEHE